MPSINCEINIILNWSANCVIWSNATANQATTNDNAKLLRQLKSGFKKTITGRNISKK